AEFLNDADGWHRGCVAQRAEGAAQHVFGKFTDQINVFAAPEASVETLEHLAQPSGAFTARDAPAARFVRIEMHNAPRHIHHAGVFVHHYHAAGTHHAADFGNRVVVHRDIDFFSSQQRTRTATGNHSLQLLAVRNASGHAEDELFHVHAERDFVNARLVDMP